MKLKVVKGKDWYGRTDFETGTIEINEDKNKTKAELADTLAHEKLHLQHPHWSEKKVEQE